MTALRPLGGCERCKRPAYAHYEEELLCHMCLMEQLGYEYQGLDCRDYPVTTGEVDSAARARKVT